MSVRRWRRMGSAWKTGTNVDGGTVMAVRSEFWWFAWTRVTKCSPIKTARYCDLAKRAVEAWLSRHSPTKARKR